MKKKRLFLATLILMVAMTACGGKDSDKDDDKGKDKDSGKKTEQTAETLQEVSEKDFDKVSEEVFGVAIENEDWEVKTAKSPNGVNNLTVTFEADEDVDGEEIIKKYFEETKATNWAAIIGVVAGAVVGNLTGGNIIPGFTWGIAAINNMVVSFACYFVGKLIAKKK